MTTPLEAAIAAKQGFGALGNVPRLGTESGSWTFGGAPTGSGWGQAADGTYTNGSWTYKPGFTPGDYTQQGRATPGKLTSSNPDDQAMLDRFQQSGLVQVGQQSGSYYDPNAVQYDPTFGWVTSSANIKPEGGVQGFMEDAFDAAVMATLAYGGGQALMSTGFGAGMASRLGNTAATKLATGIGKLGVGALAGGALAGSKGMGSLTDFLKTGVVGVDVPSVTGAFQDVQGKAGQVFNTQQSLQQQYLQKLGLMQPQQQTAATQAAGADMQMGNTAAARGDQQFDRYMKTYAPIENQQAADAAQAGSAADQAQRAAEAGSDVADAFSKSAATNARRMAAMGINPASGRYQGAMNDEAVINQATTTAAAENAARQQARDLGWQKRQAVVQTGSALPGQANQFAGTALNAVNAAPGVLNSTAGSVASQMQGANAFQSPAMDALRAEGSAAAGQTEANNTNYKNLQGQNDATWQNIGSIAGAIPWGDIFSSKKVKTGKRPVNAAAVLKKVGGLPVQKWKYKAGTPGQDPNAEHIGPYAEDMQQEFGVGNGTTINPVDMHGVAFAAIKGLHDKVRKLESQQA